MGALRSVAGSNLRPRSIIEWFVWIRSANEIVQRNVVPGARKTKSTSKRDRFDNYHLMDEWGTKAEIELEADGANS
jgi:hypothetical protein